MRNREEMRGGSNEIGRRDNALFIDIGSFATALFCILQFCARFWRVTLERGSLPGIQRRPLTEDFLRLPSLVRSQLHNRRQARNGKHQMLSVTPFGFHGPCLLFVRAEFLTSVIAFLLQRASRLSCKSKSEPAGLRHLPSGRSCFQEPSRRRSRAQEIRQMPRHSEIQTAQYPS